MSICIEQQSCCNVSTSLLNPPSFGPFLQSTTLGVWNSISKKIAALLEAKAVKDSFNLWARSQLDVKLDAQASFDVHDHEFFLKSLGRPMENDR